MLESNLSADTGGMTEGQGFVLPCFIPAPFDSPESVNSGGSGGRAPFLMSANHC